jgi:hypothetical protein
LLAVNIGGENQGGASPGLFIAETTQADFNLFSHLLEE